MATKKDISIRRGRRWAFSGTATKDGSEFDLTGYSMKFEAAKKKTGSDPDIEKELTPDPDQETNKGKYTGVFLPSETRGFSSPVYDYEINVYDATGEFIYTPLYGKLTIETAVDNNPTD